MGEPILVPRRSLEPRTEEKGGRTLSPHIHMTTSGAHLPEIRVGLPSPGGALAAAARALGYKVMVSANSFVVRNEFAEPVRVRRPGMDFVDLDAALDSGGFVGMAHYGDLPLPTVAYVHKVVAAYPWAWYAQPDYCCEPKVAASRADVRLRQAASVALYMDCRRIALRAGLPAPVAVLQGWAPDDYHRSWDLLPLDRAPPLIGVGSVCARPVHGPSGLMAVIHRIDRILPVGVQVHLFGVKSAGIKAILYEGALDGRVRSIDSMAWDFAARIRFRTGRTIARRVSTMRGWHERQAQLAWAAAAAAQIALPVAALRCPPAPPPRDDPALEDIVDLLAAGEVDLRTAAGLYQDAVLTGEAPLPLLRRPPRLITRRTGCQSELPLAA